MGHRGENIKPHLPLSGTPRAHLRITRHSEQAFEFSQAIIPRMLPSGGTLLFTGATMAMRAGANFSAMAPGSFSRRALAQSLAREFGPKNIHVCHVIVDGIIDTQRVHGMMGAGEEGTRILPDDIAQVCSGRARRSLIRVGEFQCSHPGLCRHYQPAQVGVDSGARHPVRAHVLVLSCSSPTSALIY